MATTHFQYAIELFRGPDGDQPREQLATVRVEPDWEPAKEAARFRAVREHPREQVELGIELSDIVPTWHETLGEPYLAGVKALIHDADGDAVECAISSDYFKPLAQQAAASLIKSGKLAEGESYRYLPSAYSNPTSMTPTDGLEFDVQPVAQSITLKERRVEVLLEGASPYGEVLHSDVPVFIPQQVIEETTELMQAAGEAETGGVLIGHLHRDMSKPEIIIEVTAQVHARHAQGELTALTFTADSWKDTDAAIALRGLDEIKLGWWHTHPARAWCSKCPVENRRTCPRSGEFFSAQDSALHRTVFPRAYSIALVVSDSYAHGLTYPLFGWRDGLVEQRGFHVIP